MCKHKVVKTIVEKHSCGKCSSSDNIDNALVLASKLGSVEFSKWGCRTYLVDFKMDGQTFREVGGCPRVAIKTILNDIQPQIIELLLRERDELRKELSEPKRVTAQLFGDKDTVTTTNLQTEE